MTPKKKKQPKLMGLTKKKDKQETAKVDEPEILETNPGGPTTDTSENLQKIKEILKKIIQYFILGGLIALFTKQFLIDDNETTAYLIAALRSERRLIARQQQNLQNTLADINDLTISSVQAETPNLVFATQAAAEIVPPQGTSEMLTPDEEDFLDSVMHIKNSGYPEAIQNVMIEMLRNSLNITTTII